MVRPQRIGIRLELVQETADGRIDELLMAQASDEGALPPSGCGAAGRHVGRLIPTQQGGHAAEVFDFA